MISIQSALTSGDVVDPARTNFLGHGTGSKKVESTKKLKRMID